MLLLLLLLNAVFLHLMNVPKLVRHVATDTCSSMGKRELLIIIFIIIFSVAALVYISIERLPGLADDKRCHTH